jgi:hypothetical protein
MEKVTNSDIPSSLAEKLDSLMLQRAEEARRIVQEKSFKTYRYATEEDVRNFCSYKRETDFISLESMSIIKIMEGSTYLRLFLALSEIMNCSPIDLRIWTIDNVEKSCNQRVSKQVCLEEMIDSYIDHNKFYVEDLSRTSLLLTLSLPFFFFQFFPPSTILLPLFFAFLPFLFILCPPFFCSLDLNTNLRHIGFNYMLCCHTLIYPSSSLILTPH